ncbi:hypothetical protein K456DRAFT_37408 [Colletotrichum gloeosporioides 23]|nr:hypothetical protein K456DRAFT_37408 [Colletotrichum gloeosporioides 23]KAJ0269477.1 hypothetical protein COL940_012420 [Colletotrichum noveboracense]KAJ0281915.1 hypothetical protein CBS470a_008077 [Colletotrichum nupharicola]KAJ0309358.1 hypothetical protein Brms1b_009147 [Colletotrichum noveboracense]KAJ3956693.1 hypothetical protein N0V92_006743 [Colletotrichum tropicale]
MHLTAFSSLFLGAVVVLSSPIVQKRDIDLNEARCPDYCAGTNASDSSGIYVCGDDRLGPKTLPSTIPLGGIAGLDSTYRRFGGLCPGEYLAKWWDEYKAGGPDYMYPKNQGYGADTAGHSVRYNFTLLPGVYIDRFGSEWGNYTAPAGTPYSMRSLPPRNLNVRDSAYPYNYYVYKVEKAMVVEAGPIAPHFGQPGLGLQFMMPAIMKTLVEQGNVTRVNLTANPNWSEFR